MATKARDEISDEVRALISTVLGRAKEDVTESNTLSELSSDSIQLFELLIAFERQYGVAVNYDEVVTLSTVGDIVAYVERVVYTT